VILVDAGPLISVVNFSELALSVRLRGIFERDGEQFYTSPAVLTEAFHLTARTGGWPQQSLVWKLLERHSIRVLQLRDADLDRTHQLMSRYADRPMDFGDATLVALAEVHRINRVFTLDSDFYIYRIHDREAFDVINPSA